MTNVHYLVETLENAIIAFQEGASDERRMALASLMKLKEEAALEAAELDAMMDKLARFEETYA
jgi:hypothetical protein